MLQKNHCLALFPFSFCLLSNLHCLPLKKVVIKDTADVEYIYASSYYYMEMNTAAMLKRLDISYDVPQAEMENRISSIEKSSR